MDKRKFGIITILVEKSMTEYLLNMERRYRYTIL